MSIKKLSLASAISIGLLSTGISASIAATTPCPSSCPPSVQPVCKPLATATPICKSAVTCNPSSYGAGAAGTFKTYGTLSPWGGNTAGPTEISTFQSPVNRPTGAAATLAASGIYGNCMSGQTYSTGGAAATYPTVTQGAYQLSTPSSMYPSGTSTITIQKQLATPSSNASVATPTTSYFTGGAAAAEREGMKCVEVPENIPIITGKAAPACPAPAVVPCPQPVDPCAKKPCELSTNAPNGFEQPRNPNAIANPMQEYTTGAAPCIQQCPAPVTKCPEKLKCEAVQEIPVNPMLQSTDIPTLRPMDQITGGAAPCPAPCPTPCPTQVQPQCIPACPTAQQCPTPCPPLSPKPLSTANALIIQPGPVQPWQITGGAASLPCQASANLSKTSENVQYIERQAYSYPAMTGSTNVAVNTAPNQIAFGGGGETINSPIAASGIAYGNTIGYNQGYFTGAAAPFGSYFSGCAAPLSGCPAPLSLTSGAPISLSPNNVCGAAAPVAAAITGCAAPITLSPGATVSRIDKMALNTPISIQSQSGITFQRFALVPGAQPTGAAATVMNQFSDVPAGFWASNDINKLASAGIITGYPDRTFKPNLPVSRAEFASMLISGLNLQSTPVQNRQVFRDVPTSHWAASAIDRVYNKGLIAGYPNSTFKPSMSISRAEALTTLAKSLCNIPQLTEQEATQLLCQYTDASQIPNWARISIARALKAGLLENSLNTNMINPNSTATRADIASMLSNTRVSLALEPKTTAACPTGAAATVVQQSVTIPTLSVKFKHEVSARTGHVGERFAADTQEAVTINGFCYPAGSVVRGKIVEVLRPGNHQNGALKLAFNDITSSDGQRAALPKDVITAQIQYDRNKNVIQRIVEFPIVLPSRMIGITGRTLGGMTVIAGNGIEQTLSQGGVALGQLVTGQFIPAGRSTINSAIALGKMPIDLTTTALSGGAGLFNVSTDEIGYLVGPDGRKIARVLPKDNVSIAFGCLQ